MAFAADREILRFAEEGAYVVVTLDGDFAKILATERRSAPSLIHLRIPDLDRAATVDLLRRIVPVLTRDLQRGCVASVGPRGIRIRDLPLLKP